MSQGQITLNEAIEASEKKEISIEKAVQSNSSYMLMKYAGMFSASAIKAQQAKQLYLGLPVSAECEVFETDSLVMKNSLGKPNLLTVKVGPGEHGNYYCKLSKGEVYPDDLLAIHEYLLEKRKQDLRTELEKNMDAFLKFNFADYYNYQIFIDVLSKVFLHKDVDKAMMAFEKIVFAYKNEDEKIFLLNIYFEHLDMFSFALQTNDSVKIALVFYQLKEKEFDFNSLLKDLEFSELFIESVTKYLDTSKIRKTNVNNLNPFEKSFHDIVFGWEGYAWAKYKNILNKTVFKQGFSYFEIENNNQLQFLEERLWLLDVKLDSTTYKTDHHSEHFFYSALANFQQEINFINKKINEYKIKLEKQKEEEAKVIDAQPEEEQPPF